MNKEQTRTYRENEIMIEYRNLHSQLQKYPILKKYMRIFTPILTICGVILSLLICQVGSTTLQESAPLYGYAIITLLGGILGFEVATIFSMFIDIKENNIRHEIYSNEKVNIESILDDDIFSNSIKMSYKYLDQYYFQMRDQAQKGFYITICVALFGAILIGIGIISMLLGNAEPSYITCAAGVITEFVSAVFFYLYNKTIASMGDYHNKLVLSYNISLALKAVEILPAPQKYSSTEKIIAELIKDINIHMDPFNRTETELHDTLSKFK